MNPKIALNLAKMIGLKLPQYAVAQRTLFIHVLRTARKSMSVGLYGREISHHSAGYFKAIDPDNFNVCFKFAMSRYPWDRLVSAYHLLRAGAGKGSKEITIAFGNAARQNRANWPRFAPTSTTLRKSRPSSGARCSILDTTPALNAARPIGLDTAATNLRIRNRNRFMRALIVRYPGAAPALLKIDVQGFEVEVLRGAEALLCAFDAVYVEASFCELYVGQALAEQAIALLDAAGFTLAGVYNQARSILTASRCRPTCSSCAVSTDRRAVRPHER